MRTLIPRRGERRAFSEHYARALRVDDYRHTWRSACDLAGIVQRIRVPAGQTIVAPELVDVAGTDPVVLIVRLLPGQLPADVAAQAPRLANALGGARLTVAPLGTDYVRLTLHRADPLGDPYDVRPVEADGFIGVGEDGRDIALPWASRVHGLIAGSSGYGKSTAAYAQLSALAHRDDVRVAGLDASGLLLRPWADRPGADWRVSGLGGGLEDHVRVLTELCAEMDRRLTVLPAGVDNLAPTPALPLVVVAIEETSALLRAADADRKVGPVVRSLLARLLAEGRKVAFRVLLLIPRADATVLGPGLRDQCQLKISFACEREGFVMCHSITAGIDPDQHAASPPGVAVLTAPLVGTIRIRTGRLPYAEYVRRVAG